MKMRFYRVSSSQSLKLRLALVCIGLLSGSPVWASSFFHTEIIGGVKVSPADPIAASTVMIVGQTTNNGTTGEYICSASIIAQDLIVTAAHCVAEDPANPTDPAKIFVVFSTHLPASASDPSVHRISGYLVHSGWSAAIQQPDAHDVAVIRFEGGLPAGYQPAQLLGTQNLSAGETVTLAGYGISTIRDTDGSTAGTLRQVNVRIAQFYGQTEVAVDETHGKGSCNGDSGGPAFVSNGGELLLWGVTSRGDPSCATDGIYTNLGYYLDFLNEAANDLRQQVVTNARARF